MSRIYKTERQMQSTGLLKDGDYRDIRDMLERLNRICPENHILGTLNAKKEVVTVSAHEFYEEVMNLGSGLMEAGLGGAHIAIVSENCCRYVIADTAISSGVGVVTPIDVNAPVELLATLLSKCDATAVLCGSQVLENVRAAAENCPLLKTLITIDRKVDSLPFYDEIIEAGKSLGKSSAYRTMEFDAEAPAKILFTSGTTGANKGVVLTGKNLIANVLNCMDTIMAEDEGNTSMSILPMHHATEINTHIMARIASGRLTYINDNMRNMMTNIKIFKPSVITVVPMIANAFYRNIWAGAKKAGKEEKLKKGIKLCKLLRRFGIDRTHELFSDVFAPFGGNLRMIVCGGAMLNPKVVGGMNDLGIRIENGYGITECGPLISVNADTLDDHLSVGRPCPGLEVRIENPDENGVGELCVRGKSVARGYYKDDEATAKVFGKDGFFRTGDSARIDSKGRLVLVGRKKNTIVLESGKNICPEEVENVIETNIDYASDIVVYQASMKIGSGERSLICAGLYIPDEEKRADRSAIAEDMKRINSLLPAYKQIDYVEVAEKEYEKTSTRKIKRAGLPTGVSGKGIAIS